LFDVLSETRRGSRFILLGEGRPPTILPLEITRPFLHFGYGKGKAGLLAENVRMRFLAKTRECPRGKMCSP